MKKSLAIAALACAALGINAAEPVVYDFNTTPAFFPYLQAPVPEGMGITGNFEFIKNTGAVGVQYGVGAGSDDLLCVKNDQDKWVPNPDLRVRISLSDGISYGLDANGKYTYEGMELDYTAPFIGYDMDKCPTRTLWMPGWGSTDAWQDKDYNALNEADWVSTKNAIAFNRNGNSASRTGTWIQFPEFQGPFSVAYYISAQSDTSRNKEQGLKCKVVPVKGEEELTDQAQLVDVPYAEIVNKRYYKYVYNYTGTDKVALRIGANGFQLGLYHVVFTEGNDFSGIENIIAPVEDENAPVYNIMGQRVGKDYKGIVIKNGVKYVQK